MFVNRMPRYEILSEDADRDARPRLAADRLRDRHRVRLPEAVEVFAQAGQKIEGDNVLLDPDFVLEQVAKAPREFDVQARNPANNVHIGGDHMVFASVYGPPFVREGDVRREATMDDFEQLPQALAAVPAARLAGRHHLRARTTRRSTRATSTWCYALQTLTDKPYMGSVTSAARTRSTRSR